MAEGARFGLGAFTLAYRSEPLERGLQGISAAGFKLVGLTQQAAGAPLLPDRPTSADFSELKGKVESFDLTLTTLFARRGAMESVEGLVADLDMCTELGAKYLLGMGPYPDIRGSGPDHARAKGVMQFYGEAERFLSVLKAGGPEAERRGVTIVIKPHSGVTSTGADLRNVLERADSPAVRGCWDAGNIHYYEGLDPEDDLEQSGVAPLISHVCIKDHAGAPWTNNFPIPGQGEVNHLRMLKILAGAGFQGPLIFELPVFYKRDDQTETEATEATDAAMAETHDFLESVVGQVEAG
ncbi:MAG TPA: sugar phosphate isomerase/epimerase family protein [Candidatus Dormibacteraeota bacterium]|jgi:sugar phosphate isomerase/epimerase|nr:sugar phosphate isomerase/epimerase family protein [Candidatus Dormibacteraeota bacterium]